MLKPYQNYPDGMDALYGLIRKAKRDVVFISTDGELLQSWTGGGIYDSLMASYGNWQSAPSRYKRAVMKYALMPVLGTVVGRYRAALMTSPDLIKRHEKRLSELANALPLEVFSVNEDVNPTLVFFDSPGVRVPSMALSEMISGVHGWWGTQYSSVWMGKRDENSAMLLEDNTKTGMFYRDCMRNFETVDPVSFSNGVAEIRHSAYV
ncbi:hypothetical protein EPN87_02935 [archaeon]|nr:MAG: hypothetical protein EPN87_02935 [archaeon]